jgi:predicted nucleic-acid-binding Zn-ribbon protein
MSTLNMIKITKQEVKVMRVDCPCPKCGIGVLRPTNNENNPNLLKYMHKCNNCDYTNAFSVIYRS